MILPTDTGYLEIEIDSHVALAVDDTMRNVMYILPWEELSAYATKRIRSLTKVTQAMATPVSELLKREQQEWTPVGR